MLRVMVKLLMFAMWLSFPVKWCDAAIDSTLRFLFKCLNQISTSLSLHLGSVGSSHGCPVHQTLSHGHGFTTAIFMIALFQWSLARPIKALLQSRSSEGERCQRNRGIHSTNKRSGETAAAVPLLQDAMTGKSVKTRIVSRVCAFSIPRSCRGIEKRFEIALKKNTHTLKSH